MPVSIGGTLGPGADEGFYLPGPPGTLGDFWVGDRVRLHTGTGPFDFNEVDALVTAITIIRDDDNGELIVIPELKVIVAPVVCEAPSTYVFNTPSGPKNGWAWEITGVETTAEDTASQTQQFAYDHDIGDLVLSSGGVIVAGYVSGNQTDSDGPYGPTPNFDSTDLTIDHGSFVGGGGGDGGELHPEYQSAHRIAASAGTYGTLIEYTGAALGGGGIFWGGAAAAFRAKSGETPAIRQMKLTGSTLGDGSISLTFDTPPLGGSLLVIWIAIRDAMTGTPTPPDGTWTSLPYVRCLDFGDFGRGGRMFYAEAVCVE